MTPTPDENLDPSMPGTERVSHPDQSPDGIDLSLIRANLERTPLERIRRAEAGRRSALKILHHARRIR